MHHAQKMTVTTISFRQVMEDQRLKGWCNPLAVADEKELEVDVNKDVTQDVRCSNVIPSAFE